MTSDRLAVVKKNFNKIVNAFFLKVTSHSQAGTPRARAGIGAGVNHGILTDGLPKLRDFPASIGGTGETLPE